MGRKPTPKIRRARYPRAWVGSRHESEGSEAVSLVRQVGGLACEMPDRGRKAVGFCVRPLLAHSTGCKRYCRRRQGDQPCLPLRRIMEEQTFFFVNMSRSSSKNVKLSSKD